LEQAGGTNSTLASEPGAVQLPPGLSPSAMRQLLYIERVSDGGNPSDTGGK